MLPIKLIIEGLYSYQEPQKIDFTELTASGLFGIFGSVGSGKSSILEAISYALYEKTERLNKNDRRSYNMMNLKSNRSYIEFVFQNHENRTFKATREFKRNSKNFEDVKTPVAGLYELKNGTWIPLESTNVQAIIGLSYENFKRTIIIPQGQFKEFLELGEKDRTQMMKEIFNLHQYDLQDKVAILAKQNATTLSELRGQLMGFEAVSEEEIQNQKNQLTEAQKTFESTKKEFELILERFQHLKSLKAEFETLQNKKKSLSELESQQNSINALEKKLEEFERVHALFSQILDTQNNVILELQAKSKEEVQARETLNELEIQFQEVQQKLSEIQPQFEALDLKKTEKNDWELILNIQKAQEEIENLKSGSQKGWEYVEETKIAVQNLKTQTQDLEEKIDSLGKEIIDPIVLMEVEKWFLQTQNYQDSKVKILKSFEEKNEIFQDLNTQIKTLHNSTQSFEEDYNNKQYEIDLKSKEIENHRQHVLVQQQISNYAVELKEGEPCPLCGALDHPNIVQVDNVSNQLEELQNQLNQLEADRKHWQNLKEQIDRIKQQKKFIQENIEKEKEELKNLEVQISKHIQNFHWKEFQADDFLGFEQIKKVNQEKQNQVKAWQIQQKEFRLHTEEKSKLL
jgi:exonuclease SbcC